MRTKTLQLAGVLALLAVIGKYYAVPAYAQVRAALIQDRDSEARNFYQQYNSSGGCTGTCIVEFPAVPAGKRLIVKQVSAIITFTVSGATPPADVELRDHTGGLLFQFLPIVAAPANFGAQTQFSVHSGVLASYDAGQIPAVDAFTPSGQTYSLLAQISGYTIDIP